LNIRIYNGIDILAKNLIPKKSDRFIRKMQNFCSHFANGQYIADYDEIDKNLDAYSAGPRN